MWILPLQHGRSTCPEAVQRLMRSVAALLRCRLTADVAANLRAQRYHVGDHSDCRRPRSPAAMRPSGRAGLRPGWWLGLAGAVCPCRPIAWAHAVLSQYAAVAVFTLERSVIHLSYTGNATLSVRADWWLSVPEHSQPRGASPPWARRFCKWPPPARRPQCNRESGNPFGAFGADLKDGRLRERGNPTVALTVSPHSQIMGIFRADTTTRSGARDKDLGA
jgi:hypothetical protein